MDIIHDGEFDIALGQSRLETNWKNKKIKWSQFLKKISKTHRTAETFKEYLAAKKPRQSEIKDVGGFVGGYLSGGKRKKNSVLHRQLITLDLDYAQSEQWEDFIELYSCAAAMYSTHKHSPEAPRFRLIIPLNRSVNPDEYMAISRRIANNFDIENFDHTGFEPHRLMYWPSTSKDGEYEFQYQDGKWLNANRILDSYVDWTDTSEWPQSSKEKKIVLSEIEKQGDPLEKPGHIGGFCRTYTIEEAIEKFLSDEYTPVEGSDDRFTYNEGSTSGGLIIYDSKYSFSHHSTDPTSGKLCNAFDLVRLHKFGLKDSNDENTPLTRLPSYMAMIELAAKDEKVRRLIGSEKLKEAKAEFAEEIEDGEEIEDEEDDDDEWLGKLEADNRGNYQNTINNVMMILKNDPLLKNRFKFNMFEQRELAIKNLPWRKVKTNTRYLTDKDDAGVRHYLEKTYNITSLQKIRDGMDMNFMKNSFHPVKEYLDSLVWDGKERVDSLLVDYMGCKDSEYIRTVTRKMLCAAIARIYYPGIKFDYVLVLVGEQGLAKSQLISRLGREWFSDSFNTIQGKEAFEQIQGVWIVEMGELAGLKNAEVDAIKHYVSKQHDRYRVAYGRRTENFPRQCVFFATTNRRDFMRDHTGGRRFWPAVVHEIEPIKDVYADLNSHEIDQIWAEAKELFEDGETLYLDGEMEKVAKEIQGEHAEVDERAGMIVQYLEMLLPTNWDNMDIWQKREYIKNHDNEDAVQPKGVIKRSKVCVAEIWCELFQGAQKEMTRFNTKDIHNILKNVKGWKMSKMKTRFKEYGIQQTYVLAKKSDNSAVLEHNSRKNVEN